MKDKKTLALVKKAIQNDAGAFAQLCELKVREIVYLCVWEMGNADEGQDAAQEVFIHMQKGIGRLRSPEAFNVWLHRIIQNTCNGEKRKKMKQPLQSYDGDLENVDIGEILTQLPVELVEQEESRKLLVQLIKDLPEKHSRCVVLHYYNKLSYAEIAGVMGISTDMVKSYLRTARKQLKAGIESEFGYDYLTHSAAPVLAIGPALAAVFENTAAQTVSEQMAKTCLLKSGVYAGMPAKATVSALMKAAVATFAATLCIVLVVTFTMFSFRPASSQLAAEPPQSSVVSGVWEGGLEDSPNASATVTVWVRLRDSRGNPAELPGDARVLLLDPQLQEVATASPAGGGEYRFENVVLGEAGYYTVRVVDAQDNPVPGMGDQVIYLDPENL